MWAAIDRCACAPTAKLSSGTSGSKHHSRPRTKGMHTLLAVVLLALACALARPSVPANDKGMVLSEVPPREFYDKYLVRRALIPTYYADDIPRYERHLNENLLDKEINMINRMNMRERLPIIYPGALPYWLQGYPRIPVLEQMEPNLQPMNMQPINMQPMNMQPMNLQPRNMQPMNLQPRNMQPRNMLPMGMQPMNMQPMNLQPMNLQPMSLINGAPRQVSIDEIHTNKIKKEEVKKENITTVKSAQGAAASATKKTKMSKEEKNKHKFALTPYEAGYYDHKHVIHGKVEHVEKPKTALGPVSASLIQEHFSPRQIRQNPNLSKTKTLVAENLERLRIGLSQDKADGTDKPQHFHVLETPTADPAESLFGVALLAAVGASLAMALIAFGIGWYTLSKKAKAAADVDYPAYGVTGPTVDASGDRKLAQSAHMYHYQHQKQQIIAMERSGMDQRNGSVSDPESEEENEEGDYTVYECPGFATTGDMEVKNPLFQDETTPATPGKNEKPQKE